MVKHKLPSADADPSRYIGAIISLLDMVREGKTLDHDKDECVVCFLQNIFGSYDSPERFEKFIQSGILETIVKLFCTFEDLPTERDNLQIEKGNHYIRSLLKWMTSPDLTSCLNERASVLLELCLSLRNNKGCHHQPLYILTVQSLRKLALPTIQSLRKLAEKGNDVLNFICGRDTISHIPFIVEDLRSRLVRVLKQGATATSTNEIFYNDFWDFKVFSRLLCEAIQRVNSCPVPQNKANFESQYINFRTLLEQLVQGLREIELNMKGKGRINEHNARSEWSLFLPLLEELNFISKIYEGAEEQFWDILRNKKDSVRALIPRFAERTKTYDYEWLLEHNDVTDSESRMHLAMVMTPQVKLEPSLELIEKLADWSQNLGIHLLGVVQNKKLTDPQVLEDWLCRSSEAIFNSRTNPLFLECSDDPTRFHMNSDMKPVAFHDDWPAPFHYDCADFAGKMIALALIKKVRIGVALDHGFLSQLKEARNDDSSLVSFFSKGFTSVFGVPIKDLLSVKGLEDEDINNVLQHQRSYSKGQTEADLNLLSQYQKVRILGRNIKTWQKGSRLGSGSFGEVSKCLADNGFFFAAKEVPLAKAEKAETIEHEIDLLCQFNHENIVEYFGTKKEDSKLYIFLEFVNGGSLTSVYEQYPLTDLQVSLYTQQILKGLKYLHDRGVKHGDLKCANILLNKNGCVKIADFGLAKVTELNKRRKSGKGTPRWSAPEVLNPKREKYKLQADIWSVGCCILEMLTGKIPYHELKEDFAVIYRIRKGDLPFIPDTLSTDSQHFIKSCLQVEAKKRPTVAELLGHAFVKISE